MYRRSFCRVQFFRDGAMLLLCSRCVISLGKNVSCASGWSIARPQVLVSIWDGITYLRLALLRTLHKFNLQPNQKIFYCVTLIEQLNASLKRRFFEVSKGMLTRVWKRYQKNISPPSLPPGRSSRLLKVLVPLQTFFILTKWPQFTRSVAQTLFI